MYLVYFLAKLVFSRSDLVIKTVIAVVLSCSSWYFGSYERKTGWKSDPARTMYAVVERENYE